MPKDQDYKTPQTAGGNYDPNSAPVTKHGGNDAIHDGIETNQSPMSASGPVKMPTSSK